MVFKQKALAVVSISSGSERISAFETKAVNSERDRSGYSL